MTNTTHERKGAHIEPVSLRDAGADDPSMPVRNIAGHFVDCNYGDWQDFTKCTCAVGILSGPARAEAFTVSPMPLRDYFAATVHIGHEEAYVLAKGMKAKQAQEQRITIAGQPEANPEPTVIDIAEARAKLRYLDADAMVAWRAESRRLQRAEAAAHDAQAEAEARPDALE